MECLKKIEPEHSPRVWLSLNIISLLLSLFFFIVLSLSEQGSISSFVGVYMLYNLFVCIVWTFEVALPIMVHGLDAINTWYKKMEILVVLYFMVDAVITVFAYDKVITDRTWVLVDAIITTLLFFYMTMETIVLIQMTKSRNNPNTDISLRKLDDQFDLAMD